MGIGAKCCVYGLVRMLRIFYVSSCWFRVVLYEMIFIAIKAFLLEILSINMGFAVYLSCDCEW